MRSLLFLLQKEFLQMFRDKGFLRRLIIAPSMQLILFPLAANYTVKNVNIAVVDHDHSMYSQKLVSKILSSGYFTITSFSNSYDQSFKQIEKDKADVVLEIPPAFERDLERDNKKNVAIEVNAINGVKASVGFNYLSNIISDFNNDVRLTWIDPVRTNPQPIIDVIQSYWYNPLLVYYLYMVPGILVSLVTSIGGLSAALNIVKEKEVGTIEQINVTPIKKQYFILGKLLPFIVTGVAVFTIGLIIGRIFYGIVPVGHIAVMYIFLIDFMFAILGFGLLISTYSETQQQANSLMFLFNMVFNMMSGLFTAIDSMPQWAQVLTHLFPVSYFIEIMRMVVLKGSTLVDILPQLGCVFLIGLVLTTWAILNYRKTT